MNPTDTRTFSPLTSAEQFDAILESSRRQPVVIFKHSPACGTSAQAYDELEALLHDAPGAAVFLINVLTNRSLSQTIAARFRIRHESPQVLVLQDEQVRWHGSHFRVTAGNVKKAVESATPAIRPPQPA
jgi:bacillithiol system protein YtxJ